MGDACMISLHGSGPDTSYDFFSHLSSQASYAFYRENVKSRQFFFIRKYPALTTKDILTWILVVLPVLTICNSIFVYIVT
jgi:hypothetical protein